MLVICGVPALLAWGQADDASMSSHVPFVIGNREHPTETQQLAFAKGFCVAMRRLHDKENLPALRGYFDPRYLKQHGLLEGEFKVRMAPVGGIHNIVLADDRHTILCLVETGDGRTEAILLRTVVEGEMLYLSPATSPDPRTKVLTPWILRTKL
jgi:hypothetical protein